MEPGKPEEDSIKMPDPDVMAAIERQISNDEYVLAVKSAEGKDEYLIVPDEYYMSTLLSDERMAPSSIPSNIKYVEGRQVLPPAPPTSRLQAKDDDEVLIFQSKPRQTENGYAEESFVRLPQGAVLPPKVELQTSVKPGEFVSSFQREFLNFIERHQEEDRATILGPVGRIPPVTQVQDSGIQSIGHDANAVGQTTTKEPEPMDVDE